MTSSPADRAVVAPKGTHPFSSEESRAAEEAASVIVQEELFKREGFSLAPLLSYEALLKKPPTFAFTGRGMSTSLRPDPGFIIYRERIVAIPEVKYQKEPQNAVERCFRWLAVASLPTVQIPLDRVVFAFYGDAFRLNGSGQIPGQGGGVVELCTHLPVRLLVNATPDEFRAEFASMLDEIERNPDR